MSNDFSRLHATDVVLQRYHFSSLGDAQAQLTPEQFTKLMDEITALQQGIQKQEQPRVVTGPRVVMTPFGPILPATGVLLILIAVVFVFESLAPGGSTSNSVLASFGADVPSGALGGQYWRWIASCFLHIGVTHILFNAIALVSFGALAERFYGPLRFVGIYLASGIVGNILVTFAGPQSLSAGASGCIFGLLTAVLVGSYRNRRVIGSGLSRQIGMNLVVILVLNVFISLTPGSNISLWAHAGGAITGAVLALVIPFRAPGYSRAYNRAADGASIAFIVVAIGLALTWFGDHATLAAITTFLHLL